MLARGDVTPGAPDSTHRVLLLLRPCSIFAPAMMAFETSGGTELPLLGYRAHLLAVNVAPERHILFLGLFDRLVVQFSIFFAFAGLFGSSYLQRIWV